jgi:hypothetical protein
VQQSSAVRLLSESAQRVSRGVVGYVGADLHRDRDLAVAEKCKAREYARRARPAARHRCGACVRLDVAHVGGPAAANEMPVEVTGLVRSAVPGGDDQISVVPGLASVLPRFALGFCVLLERSSKRPCSSTAQQGIANV